MTDFIADLETELVAAARRRARRRVPRPRLVPVVAAVAIVVAAFAVLRGIDGSRTADDRPVPPPGRGVAVLVLPADPIEATRGCTVDDWTGYAPGKPSLGVFARPQHADDPLPGGYGFLPANSVDAEASRLVGDGEFSVPVRLVPVGGLFMPSGDLPGMERCPRTRPSEGPGVCLVAGEDTATVSRCFTDREISDGKAATVTRHGVVHGIVPDGTGLVSLSGPRDRVMVPVIDNAYEARVPWLDTPGRLEITLHAAPRPVPPDCEPSSAAYEAVPALRAPGGGHVPLELEKAMSRLGAGVAWRPYARRLVMRDGVVVWVVPQLPCGDPMSEERVCVVPHGGSPVCNTPTAIRRQGASIIFGQGARTTVAGIAPEGARHADVRIRDLVYPLLVRDGVFGGMIVDRHRSNDPVEITYR